MKNKAHLATILLCLLISVCCNISCKKEVKSQTVVYTNDFETSDLKNITGGLIDVFNGTHVLGRYNNGSFVLNLSNLPKHDLITVSFDLYIHDSWDGSQSFNDNAIGPDLWQMIMDGKTYINTTFSNSICQPGNICPSQAYPGNYPSNNNPRTGAEEVNLPGACLNASDPRGTSLYHITKTIDHSNATFSLTCLDHLIDKNVADPKCSESWSVDNLTISTIAL